MLLPGRLSVSSGRYPHLRISCFSSGVSGLCPSLRMFSKLAANGSALNTCLERIGPMKVKRLMQILFEVKA